MVDTPAQIKERNLIVESFTQAQKAEKHRKEIELSCAKTAVLQHIAVTSFDMVIKAILRSKNLHFTATKPDESGLPLDGQAVPGFEPAFIIDHQGLPGHSRRFEMPGYKYTFYNHFDPIVICLSFYKDTDGAIISLITLSHEDGIYHSIDFTVSLRVGSTTEAQIWLTDWLDFVLATSSKKSS